jgi:hypothetical protein
MSNAKRKRYLAQQKTRRQRAVVADISGYRNRRMFDQLPDQMVNRAGDITEKHTRPDGQVIMATVIGQHADVPYTAEDWDRMNQYAAEGIARGELDPGMEPTNGIENLAEALRAMVLAGGLRPVWDANCPRLRHGDCVWLVRSGEEDQVTLKMVLDPSDWRELPPEQAEWLESADALTETFAGWVSLYGFAAATKGTGSASTEDLDDWWGAPAGTFERILSTGDVA